MKTEINRNTIDENIRNLRERIKDIDFAILTTLGSDGVLRSRPMATQKSEFDGELWFFTAHHSDKVNSILQNQQVNVAYADIKKQRYISVSGKADLVKDKDKIRDLWSPMLLTWFPQGLNDPDLSLIRVRVDSAEYWDSPSSKLISLVGFAKAMVTGERPEMGEHEQVEIRPPLH